MVTSGARAAGLTRVCAAGHSKDMSRGSSGGAMGYPNGSMAGGEGPPGQAFDPLEMLQAAADLANPGAVAGQLPWLASELLKIPLGRSSISFEEHDPRFADVTWRANPFF